MNRENLDTTVEVINGLWDRSSLVSTPCSQGYFVFWFSQMHLFSSPVFRFGANFYRQ